MTKFPVVSDVSRFSEIFQKLVLDYMKNGYTHSGVCTILVPVDHGGPIIRWMHDFVNYYISDPNGGHLNIKFREPGEKLTYQYSGVKLEIILAAHEDFASKAYLDAIKEHSLVSEIKTVTT